MDISEKLKPLNKPHKTSQTPPVDIEFQNLSYSLPSGDHKKILKSINGKFCSGELTAILGPSGSGKTILLKILAGYMLRGVTGNININGRPRQMKNFHKISTYIIQEDMLQPHLTLNESITAAAKLKLGDNISLREKRLIIEEVLNLLGLENCLETRMECLSGGERKRLSIALEMVSNPPVILLDEPTSGLDTVAMKQCVSVLRTLTDQGRTVVCTIHQPSANTFQQFDQVYFIANGTCVYNGSTSDIIPYLSSVGLECPITYSPAEYITEIVQTSEEYVPILVDAIENGKINRRKSNTTENIQYEELENVPDINFATSFWTQFYVLFSRMMIQLGRNKLAIWIQLFHHIFIGVFLGLLFFGIGNDAEMALANFKLCFFLIFFFMYTYFIGHILLFPLEVRLVKREFFNRWYGLKAYFVALTLRNLPIMIVLGLLFMLITYVMTNQPLELQRFLKFALVALLQATVADSLGLAIGSIFSITNGSIIGLVVTAPGAFLCIYGMGYGNTISPVMKVVMASNYLRCALVAASQALFENRPPFECNEIYCRYVDPNHLLRDLGMLDVSYSFNILILVCYYVLFRVIAFLALRYRLTPEFSLRIKYVKSKIMQFS